MVDDARLQELAKSIRSNGVIQPIIVRTRGDHFQIIAGERRWRAAKLAGLRAVPVVVKEVAAGQEQSLLEMALIENIQREDLNPIDEALAYRRLSDEFQLTQDAIATAVGKDRATVANTCDAEVARRKSEARSAPGALDGACPRAAVADATRPTSAGSRATSSPAVCRFARPNRSSERSSKVIPRRQAAAPKPIDVHTRAAEDRLKLLFGTRVRIVRRGTRGRIEIDFASEDELIRIYEQTRPATLRSPNIVAGSQVRRKEEHGDSSDPDGLLRRLSEQTRRRRARSGAE